jgi:predicted transposase YdaD
VDDPEVEARRKHILHRMLDMDLLTKQELIDRGVERGKEQGMAQGIEQGMVQGIERGIDQGRLSGARAALRRVLARRQLAPSKGDEARIDACTDLATLDRWLDQAITAASVPDALA